MITGISSAGGNRTYPAPPVSAERERSGVLMPHATVRGRGRVRAAAEIFDLRFEI